MPQMPEPLYHSADMVRELIDESRGWPRYETVHGELLVTPAPRAWHFWVAQRLNIALYAYTERVGVGSVIMSPADVSFGLPDVLVQPDLFVIPTDEARTLDWRRITRLLLAVEVLSPSSVRSDRFQKRRLYQEQGVPLYWIVDADAQVVEEWTPDARFPRIERETVTWQPDGARESFVLPLAELFRAL